MSFKNSISFICELYSISLNKVRKLYLTSSLYDKKISIIQSKSLIYKPTLSILSCLIKYDKAKNKIEDLDLNFFWEKKNLTNKNYKKLHNFYWLFTIDLKSSNKITQSIIENWIDKFQKYNPDSWQIDILSKRTISWIANTKITYEGSDNSYKNKFDKLINKQINHLIKEISKSKNVNDKMLGCTAILIVGLSYNNEKFLSYGLGLLKKIINSSFDSNYFPKSRSIRQLTFYLKYFILIRELLKESSNEIPEYLDEIIFYLGKSYYLLLGSEESFLFNGNHVSDLKEFNKYLSLNRYKFKNDGNEAGGYALLQNKNSILCMDIGSSPNKKFSENFQSGTLSFEFIYKGEKLICNAGYFQDYKNKLNLISKSTAAHSTLIINNNSSCSFNIMRNKQSFLNNLIETSNKNIVYNKDYWIISSSHDGYLKKYGIIHQRTITFYTKNFKILGKDKLIKKKNFKESTFEIRFHFIPGTKLTKTQDNKTVLIKLNNSGWKFYSDHGSINIENGLYFGNKNSSNENQNICISGLNRSVDQEVEWEFIKI